MENLKKDVKNNKKFTTKVKEASLFKRTLIVFFVIISITLIIFPFYSNKNKEKDELIIEKLQGYETLIEVRLISLLLDTKNSIDNNYLNELEEIAIKLDKEYRLISSFNKEEKDYYGYFSATLNAYIDKLRQFEESNNVELLNESEELLNNFYDYKRTKVMNNQSSTVEDSLTNLIENGKVQIKENEEIKVESEVEKSDEK